MLARTNLLLENNLTTSSNNLPRSWSRTKTSQMRKLKLKCSTGIRHLITYSHFLNID